MVPKGGLSVGSYKNCNINGLDLCLFQVLYHQNLPKVHAANRSRATSPTIQSATVSSASPSRNHLARASQRRPRQRQIDGLRGRPRVLKTHICRGLRHLKPDDVERTVCHLSKRANHQPGCTNADRSPSIPRMNPLPRTLRIIGDSCGPSILRRSLPMWTSTRLVSGTNL